MTNKKVVSIRWKNLLDIISISSLEDYSRWSLTLYHLAYTVWLGQWARSWCRDSLPVVDVEVGEVARSMRAKRAHKKDVG